MWHKWFFIATVSTLTCLLRGTVGDIVAIDGGVDFALAVLAEIEEIPDAAGFPVPVDQTDFARTTVTETGSPIASSLFRDVEAGRPTEVEHVLADLAARARALSVDTPILDLAVRQLRVHQYRCEQR
jgi:2-dehydropantoate 2-reductase